MHVLIQFIICLVPLGLVSTAPHDPRLIGLLNVVTFRNDPCTTVSTSRTGTCFSSDECQSKGGQADGSCASGFGVCCSFTLVACGGAVTQNCTFIQNPGTPGPFTVGTTAMCQYTFPRVEHEICRIRLDFNTLMLRPAINNGDCGMENIAVTSTSRNNIPVFCGTLTGQHMYITTPDTGDLGSFTLNFDTTNTATTRTWDIKVTQVHCGDLLSIPPDGCLQYFTGVSGSVKSYGFPDELANTAYDNCIRNERGFCSIRYTAKQGVNLPFSLGPMANSQTLGNNCKESRLIISATTNSVVCGKKFNPMDGKAINAPVIGTAIPFVLRLETGKLTTDVGKGFFLDYTQIPC